MSDIKVKFKKILVFFSFFGKEYGTKIQKLGDTVLLAQLQDLVALGQKYFPRYSKTHWNSLTELLADFRDDFPFAISLQELPESLVGVFVPIAHKNKLGIILLNSKVDRGMHLSTVAHENGHLLVHLQRLQQGVYNTVAPREVYARLDDLTVCLNDPEELLADFIACLGAYPKASFQQFFCDEQGKVKNRYRHSVLLFLRAGHYVTKHYPELLRGFLRTDNKLFHWGLLIHFARLRIFVYEKHGL